MAERAADAPILEVRRLIRASPQRVFAAWTTPAELTAWHAPGPLVVSAAAIDLRPGGRYRIHMRAPDGRELCVGGVYLEVEAPRRVVYTWAWEGQDMPDSVVTVEFHARGAGTEVVLRHAGLRDVNQRAEHASGWTGIFDKFTATFDA